METPKRKVNKLSISYRSSTPKEENNIPLDNDYSPLFMSNTQDCIDSVDVVWDWNSPQGKGKQKSASKRLHNPKPPDNFTPPPPIRAEQHIQSFKNLKEQLERLRNQLILDNAEKSTKEAAKSESPRRSMPAVPKPKNLLTKSFSSESLGSSFFEDDFNVSDIVARSTIIQVERGDVVDLDIVLDEFENEDYELLSQAIPLDTKDIIKIQSSQELKRTIQCSTSNDKSVSRKSKISANVVPATKHYSQEEIEKKRKVALAKLEERRIEEIIEKKRRQALIRLENSRKKNLKIASTVIKRYNSS